ncbi:GNAT family N-acetyltransferase [Derxia lacustris]|uniref:GNAT family N-acetyltransferase n=1 Tax=Derxia lacustris TaxID=764842 RepID=UPI000A170833|nr:GNAT family N-acetyltransferase [Derxia lacustris]
MTITVETGPWERLHAAALGIRWRVFVDEQGVPADMELDEMDPLCLHALARDASGLPVATARLLPSVDGVAAIGRMAVEASQRGQGTGRRVLETMVAAAAARGDRIAELHAQVTARGFYERAGFAAVGAEYLEAGIVHVTMRRELTPPARPES